MTTDKQFLQWIHDRLRYEHGENIYMDYMHKLRAIIEATPAAETHCFACAGHGASLDGSRDCSRCNGTGEKPAAPQEAKPNVSAANTSEERVQDSEKIAQEAKVVAWHYRLKNNSGWSPWFISSGEKKPKKGKFQDIELRPLVYGDIAAASHQEAKPVAAGWTRADDGMVYWYCYCCADKPATTAKEET